ncbi:MAG: GNAT family N-acetyltransferase, partial [Dehalococcoidia bacterium]
FGGRAFDNGTAYHVDGFLGAALWLPPDVHPDEDRVVELIQRTVPEKARGDLLSILEQLGSFHPSEPHWYLPLIGVDPVHQGKGHGSALMKHALILCDRENKFAYLESTNPANIPLYERYGFELVGKLEVGTAPPLFPMVRKPR